MSYRIMARTADASTGFAMPTATEALAALTELFGAGFELTAIVDDDGDNVPLDRLAELARTEAA